MDTTSFYQKPAASPAFTAFYEKLDRHDISPLWENLGDLVLPQPRTSCVPALWRYREVRPLIMEAGALISPEQAERRVLVLENPGLRGASQVTQSLYAGIQMVMPGEVAPSHRHAASALRFIIEGHGAYTSVDGERVIMEPGDLILTPSWTFHDHGNLTDLPVVWMDGLDIAIVNMFDTSFAERHHEPVHAVTRSEGDSETRYGANLLPLEYKPTTLSSPMVAYPYARSREVLVRLLSTGPVDPRHGIKMQYVNPATGGYPFPTIAAFLQLLPSGFRCVPSRQTDATIYYVVEGRGKSRIADITLDWEPHDIFVVPSWQTVSHEAADEAVLFSFSDRAAQKALGLWREDDGGSVR